MAVPAPMTAAATAHAEKVLPMATAAMPAAWTHCQASPGRAHEVDLHDDRGGPGQALVDAQQDVGEHHPAPGRGPDEDQGDGDRDQPSDQEYGFAAVPVGEGSGEEVGDRLDQPESGDEGEPADQGGEPEHPLREQRHDGAFLAQGRTDQGVDGHEQQELAEVGAHPQPQRRDCRRGSVAR